MVEPGPGYVCPMTEAEQLPADGQYQLDLTALADGEPVNLSAIGPVLAR